MNRVRMVVALTLCFTSASLLMAHAGRADSASVDVATAALPSAPSQQTIAIADFTGGDPEMGRFLSDTLLTDLAQSDRLQLVERTALRKALDELKLQSTGLFEPSQLEKLGRLVKADKIIVGSFYQSADQLTINARLIDVETGRLTPGGGSNVTGDSHQMLTLVHRLAHLFHQRVTGEDFAIDGEGADRTAGSLLPPVVKRYGAGTSLAQLAPQNRVSQWHVSQNDGSNSGTTQQSPSLSTSVTGTRAPGYIVTEPTDSSYDNSSDDDSVSQMYANYAASIQASQQSFSGAYVPNYYYTQYPYSSYGYPVYSYPTYIAPVYSNYTYGRSVRRIGRPIPYNRYISPGYRATQRSVWTAYRGAARITARKSR